MGVQISKILDVLDIIDYSYVHVTNLVINFFTVLEHLILLELQI